MSDSRSAIPFIQLPDPYRPPKKTKPKVHKTIRGRVVYDRKRHFFSTKDLKRILKNILEQDEGKKVDYVDFLQEWGEIELLLLDLLAQQGGFLGGSLYSLIRDSVNLLIQGNLEVPKPPIK